MSVIAEARRPAVARFLLVDNERRRADRLAGGLGIGTHLVVGSGREAAEALRADRYHIVLLDLSSVTDLAVPAGEAVGRLVRLAEGALTIGLSDRGSVSAAVEVMRAGAHDCLARPVQGPALAGRIAELAHRHGKGNIPGLAAPPPAAPSTTAAAPRVGAMPTVGPGTILPMWRQEQRIIEDAIASFAGNVALAAAALQLSPSTIYRKRQAWAEAEGKRGAA